MANWDRTEYEYDSDGNPIYIGKAQFLNKPTSQDGWYIVKLTWSGGNVTRKQKAVGAWDNRTSLGWIS